MSVLHSPVWIRHDLYNQFPTVEKARISIDESSQLAVNDKLATVIPDLLRKIGTTLTHRHWLTRKDELVIGVIEDGKLSLEPRSKTKTTCPISWVAIGDDLFATEGMDNPSKEVKEIAKKVQKSAKKIAPLLLLYPDKRFSNLSITVDPRIFFQTDKKYFVEGNSQGKSIIRPVEKKDLRSVKKVLTYISMDSPQVKEDVTPINDINLGQQFCIQECEIDEEDGYHECYHEF